MTTMLQEKPKEAGREVVRREPLFFGELWPRSFMRDMERMFEDVEHGIGLRTPRWMERLSEGLWAPQIDAFEKNGQFVVRADLPGLKPEDMKVEVTQSGLTLQGERKLEKEEKREGYYRAERNEGTFCRLIRLPEGALIDKANAVFKDGVLEVTVPMPRHEEPKPRRLEVKG